MVRSDRDSGDKFELVCLADVEPEQIEWLWQERFPMGTLSIITGDPDNGKSFVTLAMASAVSTGAPWPDRPHERQPVGSVVLLSAEDDPSKTLRPRLDSLGADVSRVHLLQGLYDVGRDLDQLRQAIDRVGDVRLVIVDPASCYMGKVDTHKDSDVRRVLGPLVALAAEKNVALVMVMHLNKKDSAAIYRTGGSIGFVAAARAVWAVSTPDEADAPDRRIMTLLKGNLTGQRTGLAYSIKKVDDAPRFSWESEPVKVTANQALQPRRRGPAPSARNKAAEFVRGMLANGPRLASEMKETGLRFGINERTVRRAFKELNGNSEVGPGGFALWSLPEGWPRNGADRGPSNDTPEQLGQLGQPGQRLEKPVDSTKSVLDSLGLLGQPNPVGQVDRLDKLSQASTFVAQRTMTETDLENARLLELQHSHDIERDF